MRRIYITILLLSFLFGIGILLFLQSYKNAVDTHLLTQQIKSQKLETTFQETITQKRQNETLSLPILLYHYVEDVTDQYDFFRIKQSITPDIFETQIVTLLTHGYTPVSMDEIYRYFMGEFSLPRNPIVLTFDDGYRDFYTEVFPLLKKYNIKATFYIVSGFINKDKNYITYNQLLELAQSDLIEIGAHTVTHSPLSTLSAQSAQYEIIQSKYDLEFLVGKPVEHFAYPYGNYDEQIVTYLETSGFKTAVTTQEGIQQTFQNRLLLQRVRPQSYIGEALLAQFK